MGRIRTTPGIGWLSLKFAVYGLHKACGRYGIGIKNDDILTLRTLNTIVATLSWSGILLVIIMQIKDVCVFVANILACDFRSVLYNYYLKIF